MRSINKSIIPEHQGNLMKTTRIIPQLLQEHQGDLRPLVSHLRCFKRHTGEYSAES